MSHEQASAIQAWLGIDVAKENFVAALDLPSQPGGRQDSLASLPGRSFPRTEEGAQQCLAWARDVLERRGFDPGEVLLRAVMEATGNYSLELLFWLTAACPTIAPAIMNPHQTARYLESRSTRRKDDLTDARGLARLGTEREPAPTDPPTGARLSLRETLRCRAALVAEREASKCRHRDYLKADGKLGAILKRHIEQIDKRIKECEQFAEKILKKEPALAADAERLEQIFGVGRLTSMIVVAELGDLRRFESDRQLACFCGLSPRIRESGLRKGQMTMSKLGNSYIRRALYMSAIVQVRFNKTELAEWYHLKIAEGKHVMAALMGLMRKLLVQMYHLIKKDLTYERYPQHHRASG